MALDTKQHLVIEDSSLKLKLNRAIQSLEIDLITQNWQGSQYSVLLAGYRIIKIVMAVGEIQRFSLIHS